MTRTGKLLLVLAFSRCAVAQNETPTTISIQNRTGDLPFSQTIGTGIEHVDIGTGNLRLDIPIVSLPGRGMPFNFGLRYNALFWMPGFRESGGGELQAWVTENRQSLALGWATNQPFVTWAINSEVCGELGGGDQFERRSTSNYIYTDSSGGKHELNVEGYLSPGDVCGDSQTEWGNFEGVLPLPITFSPGCRMYIQRPPFPCPTGRKWRGRDPIASRTRRYHRRIILTSSWAITSTRMVTTNMSTLQGPTP